jgi:predicted nucleotidyltransferase
MNIADLKKAFLKIPAIKLVYLFGSQATGKAGPLSDHDFAFYLEEKNPKKRFELRLKLYGILSSHLKTDNIDVVILNDTDGPELKYAIITEGKLIYSKEPYNIMVEPRILNEYFDFREGLLRNKIIKIA